MHTAHIHTKRTKKQSERRSNTDNKPSELIAYDETKPNSTRLDRKMVIFPHCWLVFLIASQRIKIISILFNSGVRNYLMRFLPSKILSFASTGPRKIFLCIMQICWNLVLRTFTLQALKFPSFQVSDSK